MILINQIIKPWKRNILGKLSNTKAVDPLAPWYSYIDATVRFLVLYGTCAGPMWARRLG